MNVTDEMVEAGACALAVSDGWTPDMWQRLNANDVARRIYLDVARACLTAALSEEEPS